ncbi:urease accessory protein UreE [Pseudooceanicola sediminis]|uniref:Urease accessory protein UreE n=1 Tax=Pseudooceanicola sediminis TaxID=2211117 RepID=A0A399IZP2_9RHOB|nr:urease accessory protein UreE [Pseudooceanicola sediminis]KAA2313101.1 urease accessory protein UreE [Puniceibacterium sp. HSS470]RII37749.1 urease accessory protein UreE [Pseudooceanicola sediminis]|tara:strand:+ start:33445 stop:34023 length:579 start_codon:yes stop_codon:yes gene_type:complete
MIRALTALRASELPESAAIADHVTLDYEQRFIRRKGLTTDGGDRLLADLAQTISLNDGDALQLEDGRLVGVRAAAEPLLRVTGADLARLAWHVGNRHTPCQIMPDHLLIRQDKVIAAMLAHLGARLDPLIAPFIPEGGAYGHGRTQAHDHGHTLHDGAPHSHAPGSGHHHDHDHSHDHTHAHPHDHDHSHDH